MDKLEKSDKKCLEMLQEAYEMYVMNKKGRATIKTPVGMVENVIADNILDKEQSQDQSFV